jgi:hypothetical protein
MVVVAERAPAACAGRSSASDQVTTVCVGCHCILAEDGSTSTGSYVADATFATWGGRAHESRGLCAACLAAERAALQAYRRETK